MSKDTPLPTICDKWGIPWYTTGKHCMAVLYHVIGNTFVNKISATCVRRTMGRRIVIPSSIQRLSSILISCSFLWHVIKLCSERQCRLKDLPKAQYKSPSASFH